MLVPDQSPAHANPPPLPAAAAAAARPKKKAAIHWREYAKLKKQEATSSAQHSQNPSILRLLKNLQLLILLHDFGLQLLDLSVAAQTTT